MRHGHVRFIGLLRRSVQSHVAAARGSSAVPRASLVDDLTQQARYTLTEVSQVDEQSDQIQRIVNLRHTNRMSSEDQADDSSSGLSSSGIDEYT